jgi:hypothetical protein
VPDGNPELVVEAAAVMVDLGGPTKAPLGPGGPGAVPRTHPSDGVWGVLAETDSLIVQAGKTPASARLPAMELLRYTAFSSDPGSEHGPDAG